MKAAAALDWKKIDAVLHFWSERVVTLNSEMIMISDSGE
jgi:hypothetical protein